MIASKETLRPQSTEPLPNSARKYVAGKLHPELRVPFREIQLTATPSKTGAAQENAPILVYDCSGPWGDPEFHGDLRKGLPQVRRDWILGRGGVEEVAPSWKPINPAEASPIPAAMQRRALRAKAGEAVTQLHYARKGMITPEMEYIAIRENLGREQVKERAQRIPQAGRAIVWREHPRIHHAGVCARRSGPGRAHHSREHQSSRKRADDHRPELPGENQCEHRELGARARASRRKWRRCGGRPSGARTR